MHVLIKSALLAGLALCSFSNATWADEVDADPAGLFQLRLRGAFLGTTIKAAGDAVRASATLGPWLVGVGAGIRW